MGSPEDESVMKDVEDEISDCFEMTWEQRLLGFAFCLAGGMVLNSVAVLRLSQLLLGNARPFAVCFTTGNILSILSSFFLMGPMRQIEKMCGDINRIVASAIYTGAMV